MLSVAVEHGRIRSLGFVIDGRLLYLPDYSRIPEASFELIQQAAPSLSTAVIGTIRIQPHPTLGSLPQTVATAQRLKVSRVLMTKLADGITHEAWVSIGAALSKVREGKPGVTNSSAMRWTSYADYQPPSAVNASKDEIKFKALPSLVGIEDSAIDDIVQLALSVIGRHVDAPLSRMTLAPAYDGLLVEVD